MATDKSLLTMAASINFVVLILYVLSTLLVLFKVKFKLDKGPLFTLFIFILC